MPSFSFFFYYFLMHRTGFTLEFPFTEDDYAKEREE